MNKQSMFNLKKLGEFLAIVAPILCLFDCIVLPVLSAFLPFLGWQEIVHGVSDQFVTVLVLTLCLPVIVPGVIRHRNAGVALMFAASAGLMFFTNLLGENIDSMLHFGLTLATSVLLLRANWVNRRLLACSCSSSSIHSHSHVEEPGNSRASRF